MKRSEKIEYKNTVKRLLIYIAIVFPVIIVLAYIFALVSIPMWLNLMTCVIVALALYFIFIFIYDKITKRRQSKIKDKKDPFSD